MTKEEVKNLVAEEKAAAGAPYDRILAAVDSIAEGDSSAELEAVKQERDAAKSQLVNLQAAFEADEIEDDAKLSAEQNKVAKLEDKLAKIKAALDA